MNVRQVATSDGQIIRLPVLGKLEARKRRYQRMMDRRKRGSNRRAKARQLKAKTERRIANVRANWQHQVSHDLVQQAGTVVIEALNTRNMTRKGKYKRGLNREILATGWAGLRQKLGYKVARLIEVSAAYTSQTCFECGHTAPENRKTQARFECVACSYEANADINAALNILAKNGFSGSGIGAAGRGSERQRKSALERLGLPISMSRQKVTGLPLGASSG